MPSLDCETPLANYAQIIEIKTAVTTGGIEKASKEQLARYISLLAEPLSQRHFTGDEYSQVFEVVRLNMLRAMIEAFEERSKFQTRVVIVLAVGSVLATLLPYVIAPNPIFGTNQLPTASVSAVSAEAPLAPPSAASTRVLAPSPSSGPAKATQASSLPTSAGHK